MSLDICFQYQECKFLLIYSKFLLRKVNKLNVNIKFNFLELKNDLKSEILA